MALLICFNPLPLTAASSRSSSEIPTSTLTPSATISMAHMKPIDPHPKSFNGVRLCMPIVVKKSVSVVVKASTDTGGTSPTEGSEPSSDSKEEVVPVDKLPLESKLQERQAQKSKMKLAKKIRLRRKRLVRKRKLRKKGRWPPSKMDKLKNV